MCLIVVKRDKVASFSVDDFKRSFHRNSDGMGIMYVENDRVQVAKTMGGLKAQLKLYYLHMHREFFALHHRFATHGLKNSENCHPFKVLNIDDGDPIDLYMMHNGTFSMTKFDKNCDTNLSDTNLFVREYMTPILRKAPELIDDIAFQGMIHDFIGYGNKLVFMDNTKRSWIFNKDSGTEKNGCWLSNSYSVADYHTNSNYTANKTKADDDKDTSVNRYSNFHKNPGYGEFDYDSDDHWYDGWNSACNINTKPESKIDEMVAKENSLTTLDEDSIMEIIDQYSGYSYALIKQAVIDDINLAYDMMCTLANRLIEETILDEPVDLIAEALYGYLQDYSRNQKAA